MGAEVPHSGRLGLTWDRQAQRWMLHDEALGIRLHLPAGLSDWGLSFDEGGMGVLSDGQQHLSCSNVLPVALVHLHSDPQRMHVLARGGSTMPLARYRREHADLAPRLSAARHKRRLCLATPMGRRLLLLDLAGVVRPVAGCDEQHLQHMVPELVDLVGRLLVEIVHASISASSKASREQACRGIINNGRR